MALFLHFKFKYTRRKNMPCQQQVPRVYGSICPWSPYNSERNEVNCWQISLVRQQLSTGKVAKWILKLSPSYECWKNLCVILSICKPVLT